LAWQRDTSLGNLADWESSFGNPGASAANQSVPEPTTWLLLLMGVVSARIVFVRLPFLPLH